MGLKVKKDHQGSWAEEDQKVRMELRVLTGHLGLRALKDRLEFLDLRERLETMVRLGHLVQQDYQENPASQELREEMDGQVHPALKDNKVTRVT